MTGGTPHRGGDRVASAFTTASFSLSLGIVSVATPLLALEAGYDTAEIGLLVALSAVSQLIARSFMGALMRRIPDKIFISGAAVLITLACLSVAVSTSIAAFLVSLALQGVARAFFWTGVQTHAIRASTSAVGALSAVHFAGGIGSLAGPVVAGVVSEISTVQGSLIVGGAVGAVCASISTALLTLPPFERMVGGDSRRVWRRPGVRAACWSGVTGAVWRALLNSYVPVVCSLAGQSGAVIGILVSSGNAAALAGNATAKWLWRVGARGSLLLGIVATAVGTGAVGPLAGDIWASAGALVLSGLGAGILQSVGPAIATESVHPQERGDVIATLGLFRAAALFLAPTAMAAIVIAVPLGTAFVTVGLLSLAPTWLAARLPATTADPAGPL